MSSEVRYFEVTTTETVVESIEEQELVIEEEVEELDQLERRQHETLTTDSSDETNEVMQGLDQEIIDKYDVVEVLENQETHDLFCPDCNSNITRRVILKKRKRTGGGSWNQPQRLKREFPRSETPSPDPEETDVEPKVFRCLACFTIFCPTGSGFRPFNCFGDGGDGEIVRLEEQSHDKTAWWRSCFGKDTEVPLLVTDGSKPEGEPENIPTSSEVIDVAEKKDKAKEKITYRKPWGWTGLKPMIPEKSGQEDPANTNSSRVIDIETRIEPIPSLNQPEEGFGMEILKSIVYGGLVECVTSLGVVSSAAGSGATTLNILALGFANLFSGLTIIVNSLKELRREDQEDRYKELLGRRENFKLHAFLSVLSFLVFGLVPPLVYAFAFREIDDKNYKLLSAFAASLFCILLLAVIKVSVQTEAKSYFKTVVYYVSIVVSSSGISFVVGDMIGEFLKQLGWFEPNQTGVWSVLKGNPGEYPGLVSY